MRLWLRLKVENEAEIEVEIQDGDEDEFVVDVVDDAEVDWLMSMRKRLRLICG